MMVSPLDFFKSGTQYASTEDALRRINVCRDCDRLLPMKVCAECSCWMPAKTKLQGASCPLGKW